MTAQLCYALQAARWIPLATVLAAATAIGGILSFSDVGVTPHLVIALVGAIAAAVALSLDDPAHELLAAVPVDSRRRVGTRVAVVAPVAIVGWLMLDALESTVVDASLEGAGVRALLALTTVGVAATVVAQRHQPDRAEMVGASIALGWALSLHVAHDGILAHASRAWIHHSLSVSIMALLIISLRPAR